LIVVDGHVAREGVVVGNARGIDAAHCCSVVLVASVSD
jgi:hypothetical protein